MSLKEIRDEIDVIDFNIIRLLNNRMELALMAKKFKSAIKDSAREREILDRGLDPLQVLIPPLDRTYLCRGPLPPPEMTRVRRPIELPGPEGLC